MVCSSTMTQNQMFHTLQRKIKNFTPLRLQQLIHAENTVNDEMTKAKIFELNLINKFTSFRDYSLFHYI